MASFTINVDLNIGYNGEKPISISGDRIVAPGQAGGLTTINVDSGEAEWWTPSDGSRHLTCMAASPSGNTIAVAERRLKATIHVLQGVQRRVAQRLVDVCKLQIVDMAYSRDGTRFVSLADAPAHTFSVYSVDPQTERLTILLNRRDAPPAEHQYNFITFNPRCSADICTSGGGHLTFWKHESEKNSLVPLEGRVTRPNLRITCHEWSIVPGSTVVAGTTSGLLLLFNLATGVGDVAFDCNTNTNPELTNQPAAAAVGNELAIVGAESNNNNNTNNNANNTNNSNSNSSGNNTSTGASSCANSIVAIKVTKHHTIVLTEDGTLRFLACLSHLYPPPHQQQPVISNASFGANQSFAGSPSGTTANLALTQQGSGGSGGGGSLACFGSAAASMNIGVNPLVLGSGNPHALTLQRVVSVPMIEHASCLAANTSTWDTFYVGCKSRGTLTAVNIPGYNLPDVDVSTFLTTELRFRVVMNGLRNPVVGAAFVGGSENDASSSSKYFCTLDSSSILRLCNAQTRAEEARIHCGAEPSCISASNVVPVVLVGSNSGTIRCYSVQEQSSSKTATKTAAAAAGAASSSSCYLRPLLSDRVAAVDQPVRLIVPHPVLPLAIAVAGEHTLIFLPLADPVRVLGVCHIPETYEGISSLSWTGDESSPTFILAVNNSSVLLARYPLDPVMSEDLCYPADDIIVNSWRTDLPLSVAEVALTSESSLLCFGGGVDKETKFFNLDRSASSDRKDRESKPLKMPLAFRDHEKQLVAIRVIASKFLLTAATDGRVVLRDVACLLSAAPNLREIRKDALAVAPRHVSLVGGVRSLSVAKNTKRILTSGYDGSILLWSMGSATDIAAASGVGEHLAFSAHHHNHSTTSTNSSVSSNNNADSSSHSILSSPETNFWHCGAEQSYPYLAALPPADEETMDFREKRKKLALDFDRAHAKNEHERIRKQVAQLQDKLRQVFVENEQAEDDERVDLLDFVVEDERSEFSQVCGKKIDEMKLNVKMGNLRCDYVAEYIKKTRWDSMKTQLNVVEGLTVDAEEPVKVHNFAVPLDDKYEQETLRKVKFLRRMQERNKHLAAKKRAASYAALSGEIDPAGYGQQNQYGATNHSLMQHAQQGDGGEQQQDEQSTSSGNYSSQQKEKPPAILTSQAMDSVQNHLSEVQDFLFEPRDTFAKVRAVMQSKLLAARVHAMRVAFNEKFAALVSEKKQIIHQASERTNKCKIIQLQLGDTTPLAQCKISNNEDPDVVLKVDDDDVKEDRSQDPAFKKKKLQEEAEAERWRRVHGSDDGPERALKAWMDGRLDKEVKQIVARLDPPDFADEKSSKHVPQDDWTDEQQKAYREYEKKLEKLVETVTEQRRNLEKEFVSMQKATRDAIAKFDARVKDLFDERVRVAQHCSEAELARVKLALNFMDFAQITTELSAKEHHHVELQNKLIAAAETTRRFRQKLDAKKQQLAQLKADELAKERNLKVTPPFSSSEELSRWWFAQQQKRKRIGGPRGAGLNARQKQAKAAAAAAKAGQGDAGRGQYLSPDPWEFLEREAAEANEARRQDDLLIQANGAAVQYPDRPDMINEHVWQDFLDFVDDRAAKERLIKKMQEEIADMTQEDGRLGAVEDELRSMAEDAQRQRNLKQRRMIEALFDVDQLFVFRQGHVEYEQDPFITEYGDAVLIETRRVHALNGDIRMRGAAKIDLMKDEAARARELRQIEWETRHAEYQTRILELECKQLQTLRVTKQMQEFISGGGEDHNERQRAKLREKIDHVRKTMTQRIEDKKVQMSKVKRQTREREIENNMLLEQVGHADALLATRRHVHALHATDTDAELPQRLMRDMRITRRLEDVARAQLDEMSALKKEVDRLRERTFPSFAVVSKRVIGNIMPPDVGQLQQQQQQQVGRPHSSRV